MRRSSDPPCGSGLRPSARILSHRSIAVQQSCHDASIGLCLSDSPIRAIECRATAARQHVRAATMQSPRSFPLSVGETAYQRIRADIVFGRIAAGAEAAARPDEGRVRRRHRHAARDPEPAGGRGPGARRGAARLRGAAGDGAEPARAGRAAAAAREPRAGAVLRRRRHGVGGPRRRRAPQARA